MMPIRQENRDRRLGRRRNATSVDGLDLAGIRRACGITQQTIADALRVSLTTVSAWERRAWRPSEAYCRVIAGFRRHLEVTGE